MPLLPKAVAMGGGELAKLEARELADSITEEREEREEASPGSVDEDEIEDVIGSDSLKVEVGGVVDVTEGTTGIVVEVVLKQSSVTPGLMTTGGAALPTPLASLRTITTLVPAAIVTRGQVSEAPPISVKRAIRGPSAVSLWKPWKKFRIQET